MSTVLSAFDIPPGTRVEPKDSYTAFEVLGRGRVRRGGGTTTAICRGGDYVLVRWDNDSPIATEDTVHWANLRPEGGEAYRPDLVVAEG